MVAPHLRNRTEKPGSENPVRLTKDNPDSIAPEREQSSRARWGAVALGATALLGMANQAAAQEPEPLETSISTQQEAEDDAEWGVAFSHTNDSYTVPGWISRGDDLRPYDDSETDDDGWTAELKIDVTRTQGNVQDVMSGRLSMLTEQGAWLGGPDYQGRRADLGELTFQRNFKVPVNDRLEVVYGLGGGIQASGDLNGLEIQEWWHENGGFGGRTGSDLQRNYLDQSNDYAPLITGGVGARYRLNDNDTFALKGSVQSNIALGRGLSSARSEFGVEYQPHERLTFEAGGKLDAVHSTSNHYDFYDVDGVRPGYYVKGQARLFRNVSVFGRIDDGGFRDEPVATIGIQIGGGSRRPWLNPSAR